MLRDRVASVIKWPIYAALVVAVFAASALVWVGLVYLGILTARRAGW